MRSVKPRSARRLAGYIALILVAAVAVAAGVVVLVRWSSGPEPDSADLRTPTVSVPSGTVPESAALAVLPGAPDPPPNNLDTYSIQLAPPVRIAEQLEKATVRFPVDLAHDLTRSSGHRLEPTSLFIAVYNDDLHTWIPLATEYDAATSTVSAVAPHFSWYSVDVVDYAKALAIISIENVLPGWAGVALRSRELRNTIIDSLRKSLKLDQLHDNCGTKKDPDYQVAFDLGDLSGCVVTDPTKELQVENHSAIPFDIALPPGATAAGINFDSLRDEDLPDLLAHLDD